MAQPANTPSLEGETEDQLIAEAIWSLVDFGLGTPQDTDSAFEKVSSAFPESGRVAYWQGRFGAYASNHANAFSQLSEMLQTLAQPQTDDFETADPVVQGKIQGMRHYAKVIGERIKQRAQEVSADTAAVPYEVSLLDAVGRDPTLIAAWAGLLESSDRTIALAAADAWAAQEPENALPLYAKAVVLARDAQQSDDAPVNVEAIVSLEQGNARPFCRAPEEPWPATFTLTFPQRLPKELSEFAGKRVSPFMFRTVVEETFHLIDAIGTGATISESSLRNFGSLLLNKSHRLSLPEDVRYLRAFVDVGIHMIQSNRFMYGVSAGNVDRVLNRLETIAVDHGDFENAIQYARIREDVIETRSKVAHSYRAAKFGQDPSRVDREAAAVMAAERRSFAAPGIEFADAEARKLVVSGDLSLNGIDWLFLPLFYSADNRVFVRGIDQEIPVEDLDADELAKQGYREFGKAIAELRISNRNDRLKRGLFFVIDQPYLGQNIADECYHRGYVGKRDPCIVAFTSRENLEAFREYYPYVAIKVAQILGPGGAIDRDIVETVSPLADLVVAPMDRLIDANNTASSFVESGPFRYIAIASESERDVVMKRLASVDSVDAVAFFGNSL
ncbi:hypothetical protein [Rhodopirellula sp. SWK7]|uniref:hypothetical protein n=1 Tax=Rhodopirellula sp. SWK7 TaxID=595460 RepID=UPI0002BFBCBB|nr:hypothetical protein [Rhodopirellula sp. SWK7]EMI44758.1 hypothetical protein RRSWK_02824 [Rhodopirellula sp. SWK7]